MAAVEGWEVADAAEETGARDSEVVKVGLDSEVDWEVAAMVAEMVVTGSAEDLAAAGSEVVKEAAD